MPQIVSHIVGSHGLLSDSSQKLHFDLYNFCEGWVQGIGGGP